MSTMRESCRGVSSELSECIFHLVSMTYVTEHVVSSLDASIDHGKHTANTFLGKFNNHPASSLADLCIVSSFQTADH